MGKRELLIVSVFILAGLAAFRMAAPAAGGGRGGFSFSSFIDSVRRDVRGNRATASITTRGNLDVDRAVSEVRISSAGRIQVTGEARRDIGYELTIESNGPDEAAARVNAAAGSLIEDTVGPVLTLRPAAPRNVRQSASLVLKVPSRLAVRITGTQGGARLDVAGVAALHLDAVVGDVQITGVAGAITGTHRNGDLGITDSATIDLTLASGQSTFERTSGALSLVARGGRSRIIDAQGQVDLDVTNQETTIVRSSNQVRVGGSGGRLTVDDPRGPIAIDVRRTDIEITLLRAVAVTVLTADARLRLLLPEPPAMALDAVATDGGRITADDFLLVPAVENGQSRVRHAFQNGTTPVALRNQRGEIEIARTK